METKEFKCLPSKDYDIAVKLFEDKRFEELSNFIWRVFLKARKDDLRKTGKYPDVNLNSLLDLKYKVDNLIDIYGEEFI